MLRFKTKITCSVQFVGYVDVIHMTTRAKRTRRGQIVTSFYILCEMIQYFQQIMKTGIYIKISRVTTKKRTRKRYN